MVSIIVMDYGKVISIMEMELDHDVIMMDIYRIIITTVIDIDILLDINWMDILTAWWNNCTVVVILLISIIVLNVVLIHTNVNPR